MVDEQNYTFAFHSAKEVNDRITQMRAAQTMPRFRIMRISGTSNSFAT
ncbi:hypothetical protein FHR70_001793 [Microvirga lupini]|uniref:Uncharacterized protein n=1 Tax=Microvirga lupini TaxID=420324 RepID=A0A7W4YX08_9HYPH|nr:hypothetical protein [Microvirga lupini]